MTFKLIVAVCKNYGIGKNNTLPWHIKEDLKHFSEITKGNKKNAIIMGRNTWNSLNKKHLKHRDNLILSTSLNINYATSNNDIIKTFINIEELNMFIKSKNYEDIWIIGGEKIYKKFIEDHLVNECYITVIDNEYDCDTFFPYDLIKNWNQDKEIIINTQDNFKVYMKRFYKSK